MLVLTTAPIARGGAAGGAAMGMVLVAHGEESAQDQGTSAENTGEEERVRGELGSVSSLQ